MYINTIITVFDDGNTNPMVQVHGITTDDDEARDRLNGLSEDAKRDGWKKSRTSSSYQHNFVKGSPRNTLTIKLDSASLGLKLSATR